MAIEKDTALAQADKLSTVKSADQRKLAADLWDAIRAFRKQAEGEKEAVCRPLKQAWEDAKRPFDAFIKECEAAERKLQTAMAAYDLEQRRRAEAEQAKLAAKIEAQNQRALQKAVAKGIEPPPLKPIPIVPPPPASITTQAGTTQTARTIRTYHLVGVPDDEPIRANDPRVAALAAAHPELFRLDWAAFRAAGKAGVLDGVDGVALRENIIYSQKGGAQ